MEAKHPFDEWDDDKSKQAFLEQALRDSSLVFQVFSTEAGELLLKRWVEVLIWSPTAAANKDQVATGIDEGYKAFIRSILKAIKAHEEVQ